MHAAFTGQGSLSVLSQLRAQAWWLAGGCLIKPWQGPRQLNSWRFLAVYWFLKLEACMCVFWGSPQVKSLCLEKGIGRGSEMSACVACPGMFRNYKLIIMPRCASDDLSFLMIVWWCHTQSLYSTLHELWENILSCATDTTSRVKSFIHREHLVLSFIW